MKIKTQMLGMLLAVSLLAGCGAAEQSASMGMKEYAVEDMAVPEEGKAEETLPQMGADTVSVQPIQTDRKLIRTVNLQIETKQFEDVTAGIEAEVRELGGYMEQSSMDSGSGYDREYYRSGYMMVRIPSDKLDSFVESVKETSNVTNISESTEDITLNYVDVESRKKALETERDRLMELLEKAETVEEIITIEGRLSEVRYQLESYTSQLRTYDNQVDYSTVHINISEVEREVKAEAKGFWEEVQERFANSFYNLGHGIRSFAIWFLGSLPYLILWAVLIGGAAVVFRLICKKKKRKETSEKKEE